MIYTLEEESLDYQQGWLSLQDFSLQLAHLLDHDQEYRSLLEEVILTRLPYTLLLMTSAAILSFLIAVPLGAFSAIRQYSNVDMAITTSSCFRIAMPTFWFGLLLIAIFSGGPDWLAWGEAATQEISVNGDIDYQCFSDHLIQFCC